jgi:hypothetical protein
MIGSPVFDPAEAIQISERILEIYIMLISDTIEELGELDQERHRAFISLAMDADKQLGGDADWRTLLADWKKVVNSVELSDQDQIELAKSVQERFFLLWQQLSRFVGATLRMIAVSEASRSETPITDGNNVRNATRIASGRQAVGARTTYETAAFKVMGDLAECLNRHEQGLMRKLCYLTYTMEIMKGIVGTLSQFTRIININHK